MRVTRDFRLETSIKTLLSAFVRPILEYEAVVWDSHADKNSEQLERVQCRILHYASFILKMPCERHNYMPLASILGLISLTERRYIADNTFLAALLNNDIDSLILIFKIYFKVPSHSILLVPLSPFMSRILFSLFSIVFLVQRKTAEKLNVNSKMYCKQYFHQF